ncbi:MAG: hypothetical protein Q9185_003200 [Variospora sp. 1 TL-2023]
MAHAPSPSLKSKFAASLPQHHRFTIHHLSTPPTSCPALHSAPPGQKPEKTYCESHFLTVSIAPENAGGQQVQILALETLIYTTSNLTTVFVAKADSTGYLYLLNLPRGTPSPLKTISSVFLSHLVATRQRKDRRLVVSLFARAQDQYLFPGSVENPTKHVLDDRGLVRWWCRVLGPVLQAGTTWTSSSSSSHKKKHTSAAEAYLRVPGCDVHETRSFFPPSSTTTTLTAKWHPSRDPLRHLGRSPTFPERCLIPRFPDDPKARFVDELDEELTDPPPPPSSDSRVRESPSKGNRPGRWRSVRSLEEFWELMAFRQECSSGRLVGFLWAVFTPEEESLLSSHGEPPKSPTRIAVEKKNSQDPVPALPPSIQQPSTSTTTTTPPPPLSESSSQKTTPQRMERRRRPGEKTAHYFWPPSTRGTVVLPQKHYDRATKLLLHLDYATLEVAAASTKRWVEDVGMCAERQEEGWGVDVVGEMKEENGGGGEGKEGGGVVHVLGMGMVRKKEKKKRLDEEEVEGEKAMDEAGGGMGVQMLSTGLVRKKPKIK